NALSAALDALTILVYLGVYTPLKRVSPLSTLVGAVPGALPPMIGWAAATGSIAPGAWVLFAIVFLWQIPHFLAIGRMYREDYERGGFPMLVVVDADGSATGRQMILYAATLVPVSTMPGPLALSGAPYCFAALMLGLSYLGFSVAAARRPTPECARRLLLCSIVYLPLLLASMLIDRLFA
ncbi:MAG: protoheme IX farnesyltransferase, partial [Candidatus Binatia bacterium]